MLLLAGWPLRAEPLYPLLRPATADSLQQQLRRTPPGRQRLGLLLRLGQDIIVKFGAPLDSAEAYCREAAALSRRLGDAQGQIESSYALGNLCLARNQVAEGTKWLAQGLASSARQHYVRLEADGWYYLSATYTFSGVDIPRRIDCLRRAMALYRTLGDASHAAYTLKTIADLHMQQGQEGLAREELRQVLARYRAIGYRRLHYTYDLLGVVSSRLGDYQGALHYGLASIESARATRDTADLNLFYHRVGATYYALNQYSDALTYYNLAMRRAEQSRDANEVLVAVLHITEVLIAQHQPRDALRLALEKLRQYPPGDYFRVDELNLLATCYLASRQIPLAEKTYLELIALLESRKSMVGNQLFRLEVYFTIGQLYLDSRRYGKARFYLAKAEALQPGASLPMKATLRLLFFRLDSAQGNYVAAIAQQQRYQALHDSIFNEKKSQQIAGLQIQYDTRKKEQDLTLLTKQSLVQQANLRQREGQRNALLAGVAMLALLLGLGYNRYRLKQRSNQLLEARQEEIDRKNAALQTLVLEKEWLLKEIHHRVKNNLQVVMSLLNSQASYLTNDTALAAIHESQHRVQAMALIHQKLYQSEQVARIDMPVYINELAIYLRDSYDLLQPIKFELAVEPIEVDVTMAVPLGLIINEAITNALKYAFPQGRAGRICLSLQRLLATTYQLTIEDDGVGLPPNYAPENSCSLGMTLIHGFSRQLGGKLTLRNDHGLKIILVFSEPQLKPAHARTDYAYQ
ncbi:tetratricopeptide repeat-containing sensor histidine kinase [Hymenobacter terricola]|uniref:tetratricopeptide repeat-containing sensor histidine kinase n=1 Tax=Hymenobacter terricola TaxID=2819236 RepID=UPI001B30DE92|nr:histidine kinase dimerization/phosphoacceptor domain -containing protein [Hymenobacter terricola]